MIKHFDTTIYKHKIELIFDLDRHIWYALHPKYGQYVSGNFWRGRFERNHNLLIIGRREYELVIDCDDSNRYWESWSVFDIKKQDYLPTSGRLDGGEVWHVFDENGKLMNTTYSQDQAEFDILFYKQQTGNDAIARRHQ